MVHVAHKLEQMHEAGWAHRDLKPGNAIWLPSSNSWTLIDFGSASRIGAHPTRDFLRSPPLTCVWGSPYGIRDDLLLEFSSGEESDLAFTIKYAAPETIQAFKRKDETEICGSAVDVWALGV